MTILTKLCAVYADNLSFDVMDPKPMQVVLRCLAAEIERRGEQGLDLDPGEIADWLRQEAEAGE